VARRVLKNARMKIALALSFALAGCAVLDADVRGVSTPTALTVTALEPPPAPLPDEKTPSPGPAHIWVAGYWDYVGGHHVWRAGRWVECKAGYEYVRARYEWNGTIWTFHVPHWKRRATEPSTNLAKK
jgi:hypothetical protein